MKVADLIQKLMYLDLEAEVLMDVIVCYDGTEMRPVLDVVPVTGRIEDGVFRAEEGGVTGYRLVEDPAADHIRQANSERRRAERTQELQEALPPTDPVIVELCLDWEMGLGPFATHSCREPKGHAGEHTNGDIRWR